MVVLIGMGSLLYTHQLAQKITLEERKRAEMLANAWLQIVNSSTNDPNLEFYAAIIENNENIPVMVLDSMNQVLFMRNLDSSRINRPKYAHRQLKKMKENARPIIISLSTHEKQFLYYNRSALLYQLSYYPYIQLCVVLLFILAAYYAFRASQKYEQNQVWIGMSKETAHQLGTPISSLMAWLEMMRMQKSNFDMLAELEKDISRLETITERFSKIGAKPILVRENILQVIETAVNYIRSRSSDKIRFQLHLPAYPIPVPLNSVLLEWVIENLCKNAMDAMAGKGDLEISVSDYTQVVYLDISDTGKGISRSMFQTIFQPGFTTKPKGWGVGLSLAKRIIEEYHNGRIFVHQSDINRGSVIRIVLKK
jgi:hypothetical protein